MCQNLAIEQALLKESMCRIWRSETYGIFLWTRLKTQSGVQSWDLSNVNRRQQLDEHFPFDVGIWSMVSLFCGRNDLDSLLQILIVWHPGQFHSPKFGNRTGIVKRNDSYNLAVKNVWTDFGNTIENTLLVHIWDLRCVKHVKVVQKVTEYSVGDASPFCTLWTVYCALGREGSPCHMESECTAWITIPKHSFC